MNHPHFTEFLLEHGRLPRIGDEIPPWHYQGWMLPIIQLCHHHPSVVNRWGYYMRVLEQGHIGDEPIPRIDFCEHGHQRDRGLKHLNQCVDILDREFGGWDAMYAFIDWLTFAIGVDKEPRRKISEERQEELYRTFNLEYWLTAPADYFGDALCELKGKRNRTGFYPTPENVVSMMVQMTMHDGRYEDLRRATVMEPCVGTGRMLLHASNYSLRLYGMDIDERCVQCTLINGALYAPWITFPFPESIFDTPGVAIDQVVGDSSRIEQVTVAPAVPALITALDQPPVIEVISPNLSLGQVHLFDYKLTTEIKPKAKKKKRAKALA
jgi:hypothetical protein